MDICNQQSNCDDDQRRRYQPGRECLADPRAICRTGSGYSVFAGREAARALAKMSLREEDCVADLEGLTQRERDTLRDWEERLLDKYSVVGQARQDERLSVPCQPLVQRILQSLVPVAQVAVTHAL